MATILLIDDENPIRANLRRFLEMEGYTVIEAENGMSGLSLALGNIADLIICDVMMPELDGFALLARLRASPEWREVPFIFLSASAEMDVRLQGFALGAIEYITKPFHLIDVMALVRRRLES